MVSTDDMFETLLGDVPGNATHSSKKSTTSTLDGNEFSESVAVCSSSIWILIAANITNNYLVMCRKSRNTKEISFVLQRSTKSIVISAGSRNISVPSFVSGNQVQTLALAGCSVGNKPPPTRTNIMHAKPVFSLVQSADHSWNCCNSVTSVLFLSLFGLELDLCKAPVLLIGSQNGNIYFTNFTSIISREPEDSVVGPLYSLEQPIVGIHYVYFPMNTLTNDNDPLAISWDTGEEPEQSVDDTPNMIIFVGQRGKIAICHSNLGESKFFPNVVEFQLPAPVISSILVPKICLLFTTLQGLYRICLRQVCAKCFEEKASSPSLSSTIRIPHVSFKFPEKIVNTSCLNYLLKTRICDSYYCSTESRAHPLQCSYGTTDGNIMTIQIQIHDRQAPSSSLGHSIAIVGQDIKQCLQSIQVVADKIHQAKKKLASLNTTLADLKGVLEVLSTLRQASTGKKEVLQYFACSFHGVHENIGLRIKKLYMDVRLTYTRPEAGTGQPHKALGAGWSFFITMSSHSSGSGSSVSSKSVSMEGMAPGDSVYLRMEVELIGCQEGMPVTGSIHTFIHYTPQHLCDLVSDNTYVFDGNTFKGICISFCSKILTILDFLQPAKPAQIASKESLPNVQRMEIEQILSHKMPPSLFSSSKMSSTKPSSALLFSINFPVWPMSAMPFILASSHTSTKEELVKLDDNSLCSKLMCVLLPIASIDGATGRHITNTMAFTLPDGSSVSFKVSNSEGSTVPSDEGRSCGSLRLLIKSSSKSCLVQVVSAVHSLLVSNMEVGLEKEKCQALPPTHTLEQLSKRLTTMKCLHTEVRNLNKELYSASHKMETNCMKLDVYEKKLHSIISRVFSVFCKLREIG